MGRRGRFKAGDTGMSLLQSFETQGQELSQDGRAGDGGPSPGWEYERGRGLRCSLRDGPTGSGEDLGFGDQQDMLELLETFGSVPWATMEVCDEFGGVEFGDLRRVVGGMRILEIGE
mmetsp:Transcript_55508/g.146376  ORF Transcript_55508/g.146376 Transcript_55508/m.146376 type:complete len:117 (-) Transcript_55508:28-378(-)